MYALLVRSGEFHQGFRGLAGLIGGFFHAGQEEAQPRFPIAGEADGLQEVVVLLAVLLEVEAEIKQRLAQHAFRAEQKGDEQPAQASVAVEKRMDGFKMDVRQRGFDQERGFDGVVVQEFFQRAETFQHLIGRRRNEQGVAGARAAHPILGAAECAGLLFAGASLQRAGGAAQFGLLECRGMRHETAAC